VVAPVEEPQLLGAGDLVAEPDAAGALDAPLGVEDDVGAQVDVLGPWTFSPSNRLTPVP